MIHGESISHPDRTQLDEEFETPASKKTEPQHQLSGIPREIGNVCLEENSSNCNNLGDHDKLDSENEDANETNVDAPEVGMLFESYEAVYEFYKQYAISIGFGIIKQRSEPGDSGLLKSFTLACCKSRKPKHTAQNDFRKQPTTKTNCPARIKARLSHDTIYILSVVVLEHNHELNPSRARLFRSNKKLDTPTKRRLELNDRAGIKLSKTFNSFLFENGGHENMVFGEKDCRNYMDQFRRQLFSDGDAQALLSYFMRMQKRNSNFYYAIDVDEENRVKNVFWADARCRAAYESFSDVVTFDSTYLTNKYDMPFAPFVGVNHHNQSILFGCGLLSDESTTTYTWLFRVFLDCMHNVQPKAIITDQCAAMKNAILEVFSDSYHRLCIWHIMKKVPEKFGRHICYHEICTVLHHIVYDSLRIDEFEEDWNKMLESFGLQRNEWLQGLFRDRRHWVPIYVKDKFWAGMSSSQRSESMNSFFDDYVHSKTTLKQFVDQYDAAMQKKIKKEVDEDFRSSNARLPLITDFLIESQAGDVYTNGIFKEFQQELKALMYCSNITLCERNGPVHTFRVKDISKRNDHTNICREHIMYGVSLDKDKMEVKCICKNFEFRGILCRHAICVLMDQKLDTLPPQYILSRWRKDIKRPHTDVRIFYDEFESTEEIIRYEKLHARFITLARIGAKSSDKYDDALKYAEDLEKKLLLTDDFANAQNEKLDDVSSLGKKLLSPLRVSRKGRPPSRRKQSKIEKRYAKKKKVSHEKVKQQESTSFLCGQKQEKNSSLFADDIRTQESIYVAAKQDNNQENRSRQSLVMSSLHGETQESSIGNEFSFLQLLQSYGGVP